MYVSKTFYGDTCIDEMDLIYSNVNHLIELEYYKTYTNIGRKSEKIFGIEIIKKEHKDEEIVIEKNNVFYLTKDENVIEKIIGKLKNYKVTPIALTDIVSELISTEN